MSNPRHAASERRDAFSSNFHTLSHDLRTPLNHINGFAELLLLHGGLDPTQRSYVEAILRASHALQSAVLEHLNGRNRRGARTRQERYPTYAASLRST